MGKNFERTQQVRERFVRKISNSRRRRNWFSTNGATQFPRIENRTAFSKGNRQTQRRGKIGAEFKFYSAAFYGTKFRFLRRNGLILNRLGKGTLLVNTIHPAPEIHEHFMIHKGYGTLCTTSSTLSSTLRPLWLIAVNTMTHTDVTTAHHWARCAPCVDESFTPSHWLKASSVSCHLIPSMHVQRGCFERLLPPVSLLLLQVPLPPLPDSCHGAWREFHGRSLVQLRLREQWSAWTMSHPTQVMSPKDMELADTNELNLATSSDIYFQDILEDTSVLLQPRHRRRRARQASCNRGRQNGATRWGKEQ